MIRAVETPQRVWTTWDRGHVVWNATSGGTERGGVSAVDESVLL